MVAQLEANLRRFGEVVRRRLGVEIETLPGAGAAGGLGAGLVAFVNAKLERGVEIVADAVKLSRRLAGADLCLTGEGRLDFQSRAGKTVYGVASLAARQGVAVICIPGQADGEQHEVFESVWPVVTGDINVELAMARAGKLLRQRAAQAVRVFLAKT